MNKTPIDWVKNPDLTPGYTWNPISGCLNGCEYCYARKLANGRLKARYLDKTKLPGSYAPRDTEAKVLLHPKDDPFYPRFWEDKLHDRGLFQEKPRGIFVCSMSDLFGIGVPEDWTDRIMDQIKIHRQHRFYLLTKQPQKLPTPPSYFPDNAWVGVSATDASMFTRAWGGLKDIQAKVKFISFEPLLDWDMSVEDTLWTLRTAGIKWVIIGAQTNPSVMPKMEWVREIVEACDKAGIPVFLKDSLNNHLPLEPLFFRSVEDGDHYQLRQEMPNAD